MDEQTRTQLMQAYHLIRAGDKKTALDILRPICQQQPDSADAWWLVANALSDPAQVRVALHKVLLIDPFHEQAQQKLDKLLALAAVEQALAPMPTAEAAQTAAKPKQNGLYAIGAVVGLFVILGLVGAAAILGGSRDKPKQAAQAAPPSPTVQATQNAASLPPSQTPTIILTYTPARTLPPTWTPSPSPTRDPNIITNTPWIVQSTLATADPALFGDTYWEGIGDGYTLETFTRSGGRHLRFYEFPIKLYVEGANTPIWQRAVQNTLEQLNQIMAVELVEKEADATLVVFVYDPNEFERWSGCSKVEFAGCATIFDLGDFGGGDTYHRIIGQAFISTATVNPVGTMLHEVLHALGVMVHSPYPEDIMYPAETERTTLSQRDLNTLRRLYANPSYAD